MLDTVPHRLLRLACVLPVLLGIPGPALAEERPAEVALLVDATQAARRVYHVHLVIPARPGPLVLVYPKWVPEHHHGNKWIENMVELKLTAAGRRLPWQRDTIDLNAIRCQPPENAAAVEADFDFLDAESNPQLAVVDWVSLLLYPQGQSPAALRYAARLRLPPGWKYATALAAARQAGDTIEFQAESLERLVDSPLLAGSHFRTVRLAGGQAPHYLDLAADSDAALKIDPKTVAAYERLIVEAQRMFGPTITGSTTSCWR